MNKKVKIAVISIVSNTGLILMKLFVGIISGSISIISEAIHSMMDLVASFIAFFSVRISDSPADERHPYGHGKFENVSGVAEALLIFIAAFWIIYKSIFKLIEPKALDSFHIGLGFIVMSISAIVNSIVAAKLYKTARETGSIALEADGLHLKTDVYTSIGVAAGMLIMWAAGFITSKSYIFYLDPIIAILVAILILHQSYILFRKAYAPLLDESLSKEEIETLRSTINLHCSEDISYHNLRTRKAGNYRYIDLHLTVPANKSVKEAHDICDAIEDDIHRVMEDTEVTIHVEVEEDVKALSR